MIRNRLQSRGSNTKRSAFAAFNFAAAGCRGLTSKVLSCGTITLGKAIATPPLFANHAAPKRRASADDGWSRHPTGKSFAVETRIASSGTSTAMTRHSSRKASRGAWTKISSAAKARDSAR